ncbi:MAG: DnaJ domain-containing protein, partial [Chloroflexi bacterium]|nr:DnaJ domain-containing protein [Chloroflexota bacterium]
VTNVALLVDKAGRGALDQRLKSLDEEFEGRLHFRCVGPLPPYSFATVEVQVPSFETVDEARRLLGLGEAATPGEIKRAYHRLASRLHPDHNPNSPEAEARMAELTQAYRLLTAYADSQALFWAGEQGSTGAGAQRGKGARGQGSRGVGAHPSTPAPQHPCTFSR